MCGQLQYGQGTENEAQCILNFVIIAENMLNFLRNGIHFPDLSRSEAINYT